MATKDYFSDLEGFGSGPALPSFSASGFSTPVSMSRRSPRPNTQVRPPASSSPPPLPSSSPPVANGSSPNTQADRDDYDDKREDDILNDPRRFTPTLHASLVSEILKVRGELDSKHKFIEDLELQLKLARDEKDDLKEKLTNSEKNVRSMKREIQQLEHGTLAALEELAKDRDAAKASGNEFKSKLEATQKQVKTLEDDSERRHSIWEKEKNSWETEKRGFERRVHITETRLKTVLEELAHYHNAAQVHENGILHEEEDSRDSGVGDDQSDTASIQASPSRNGAHNRSMSASSRRSLNRYRFSTASVAGPDGVKFNGVSLADELQLDEEDEEFEDHEEYDQFDEDESKTRRNLDSRMSQHHDDRAKRVSVLKSDRRRTMESPVPFDWRRSTDHPVSLDLKNIMLAEPRVPYVDSGVQYSPPPSPVIAPAAKGAEKLPEVIPTLNDDQIEANQRKKRVAPTAPSVDRGQQMSPVPEREPTVMVNSASQTMEDQPLSPPATPKITPPDSPAEAKALLSQQEKPTMTSISTQTDPMEEPKTAVFDATLTRAATVPIPIPSIAIHPPTSRSASPVDGEIVLPPGTKTIGTQTAQSLSFAKMISTAVQTDEVLTQKRLQRLPPHLLPSFISSNPPTPEQTKKQPMQRSVSDGPPSRDRMTSPPPKVEQRYPGNNDNGPVANGDRDAPRRPFRNSSLFAGFGEEDEDMDQVEDESKTGTYQTPAVRTRIMNGLRNFGSRPSPVPEDKEVESNPRDSYAESMTSGGAYESRVSLDKGKMPMRNGSMPRQSNSIRRSAMIQSGANAHRSRTPSVTSVGSSFFSSKSVGPPFPVPDRASSRKLFSQSKSEGSQSPTPRGAGIFGNRRGAQPTRRDTRGHERKDSLRKVRSATVIQRTNSGRRRSRSPPLPGGSSSPTFPPLPQDSVAPAKVYTQQRQRSNEKTLSRDLSGIVGTLDPSQLEQPEPSQGTVIDAIAAAMVGEWMWKYVRRRKSFGVSDERQDSVGRPGTDGTVNVTGNGVRHKRWVWLSPYERAVMWSTKQPASNSALMGKSGRKLVIQSVLDVRDDTPLPRNHGIAEPFHRSILILTPARALKFTAMSRDRHYTWLTALSFLAHSPLLTPGMNLQVPEEPEHDDPNHGRAPSLRRTRIQDSVRIAKDKARPQPGAKYATVPARPTPAINEWSAAPAPSIPGPNGIYEEPVPDAAEAPSVPRFAHGRKRSATGPRLPSSIRNPSLYHRDVVSPSLPSATSSDFHFPTANSVSNGPSSGRASEVSSGNRFNFFDDAGTVRMQAFVDGIDQYNAGRVSQDGSSVLGGKRRNPRWSGASSAMDSRRSGMVYSDDFDAFDPFKGF